MHPGALDAYRRAVDELRETLEEGAAAEAVALLRGLVDRVEIRPKGRGRPPDVTLYGRLAELLSPPIPVLGPFGTESDGSRGPLPPLCRWRATASSRCVLTFDSDGLSLGHWQRPRASPRRIERD